MDIKTLTKEVEKVSQKYAKKFEINRDSTWYVLKIQEELGELIQSYLMLSKQARQKGKTEIEIKDDFEKEIADVMCQLLLLANHYDVDLEKKIKEKWLVWNK